MQLFKKFKKATSPLREYTIQVKRKGDDNIAYTLYADAHNEDEAKESAIKFLVENAWWPCMSTEEYRRSRLIVVGVFLS